MSFRKRSVGISGPSSRLSAPSPSQLEAAHQPQPSSTPAVSDSRPTSQPPGTRPSLLDGRLTTSTGTHSLDGLLAGHAGLVVGNSILLEESGTTDYASTLLRYYAAEGVVQGHKVHVVGVGQQWGRELPGLSLGGDTGSKTVAEAQEKMRIAWRYERFEEFGSGRAGVLSRIPSSDGFGWGVYKKYIILNCGCAEVVLRVLMVGRR